MLVDFTDFTILHNYIRVFVREVEFLEGIPESDFLVPLVYYWGLEVSAACRPLVRHRFALAVAFFLVISAYRHIPWLFFLNMDEKDRAFHLPPPPASDCETRICFTRWPLSDTASPLTFRHSFLSFSLSIYQGVGACGRAGCKTRVWRGRERPHNPVFPTGGCTTTSSVGAIGAFL